MKLYNISSSAFIIQLKFLFLNDLTPYSIFNKIRSFSPNIYYEKSNQIEIAVAVLPIETQNVLL